MLDLSREIAGPYTCMFLGDMGARVIKVEPPGGSPERRDPRFFLWNRGKETVTLNLESSEGQAVVRRLIARVDVVVVDWLPAYARSLGLDYDSLRGLNPRLIYCAIPPYPEDGPLGSTPGDTYSVAASMGIVGDQGGGDSPVFVCLPLASYGAAFTACFAVSSALFVREMEGTGQKVEVSLVHGAVAMQAASLVSGPNLRPRGSAIRQGIRVGIPIYRLFQAQEGWFFLACGNNTFWNKLCIALGKEELVEDERFRDAPWGIPPEHYDGLSDILEPVFLQKPADYWVRFLAERDIPCALVQTRETYIRHPQVGVNRMMQPVEDSTLGMTLQPGVPVWMHGAPGGVPGGTARAGQHTDAVLREAGYSEEGIAALRGRGVV